MGRAGHDLDQPDGELSADMPRSWLSACALGVGAIALMTARVLEREDAILHLARDGSGSGAVSISNVVVCEAAEPGRGCWGRIRPNVTTVLEGRPAEGSRLTGWTGCAMVTPTGRCALPPSVSGEEVEVRVTFERIEARPGS